MDITHLGVIAAFGAGVVSFLSPCVFPLVPGYLSYIAGTTAREAQQDGAARWRVTAHALFFVLGFALIFALLGAAASSVGAVLSGHKLLLERVAGVMLILFGLFLARLVPLPVRFRWGVLRWCNLAEESSDKTVASARLNPQFGVKIVAWPYSRWVAECLPKTFQPSQQDPTEPAGVLAFPRLHGPETADEFCATVLAGAGILLAPSSLFAYGDRHIRIGVGLRNVPDALAALDRYLRAARSGRT